MVCRLVGIGLPIGMMKILVVELWRDDPHRRSAAKINADKEDSSQLDGTISKGLLSMEERDG